MRWYVVLWSFVMLLFVVQAVPAVCDAEPAPGQVKKKNKRKKRRAQRARKKAKKAKQQQGAQVDAVAKGEGASADAEDELEEEPETEDEQEVREQEGSLRTPGRMEFDERLVKGQAAKSGAVYLFKRVPRPLPGLVPMRRSYRKRIVEPVLGIRTLKPAVPSGKVDRRLAGDDDEQDAEQEEDVDEENRLSSDVENRIESEDKEEP